MSETPQVADMAFPSMGLPGWTVKRTPAGE